jgi:hypothetical protein
MPKTAVVAALAALTLAAVTPPAQAMPVAPHHVVFAGLNADLQDAQARRCCFGATAHSASKMASVHALGQAARRPCGRRPLADDASAGQVLPHGVCKR